jgi:hypothetical protein
VFGVLGSQNTEHGSGTNAVTRTAHRPSGGLSEPPPDACIRCLAERLPFDRARGSVVPGDLLAVVLAGVAHPVRVHAQQVAKVEEIHQDVRQGLVHVVGG